MEKPQYFVDLSRLWGSVDEEISELESDEVTGLSLRKSENFDAAHLAKFVNLCELDLGRSSVTDKDMVHLANLVQLTDLDLFGTDVGDRGMVHLANLTNLQQLNLGATTVGDEGLVYLKNLTNLKILKLSESEVSEEQIEELQKSLPQVTIEYYVDPSSLQRDIEHHESPQENTTKLASKLTYIIIAILFIVFVIWAVVYIKNAQELSKKKYIANQKKHYFTLAEKCKKEKDYAKAVECYKKISYDPDAMYHLGEMYEEGKGVSKSYSEAFDWYNKAAQQGNIQAIEKLKKWKKSPK
ncbi:SEL1-like repeat protein [Candidatus Uabimicrobium amorphum]|nr:SEL1-like repeat protein [Candidatus Uabimicrobium amorphum]